MLNFGLAAMFRPPATACYEGILNVVVSTIGYRGGAKKEKLRENGADDDNDNDDGKGGTTK